MVSYESRERCRIPTNHVADPLGQLHVLSHHAQAKLMHWYLRGIWGGQFGLGSGYQAMTAHRDRRQDSAE